MRRKEKGFSMLETLVVSGVVLVASAATVPSIVMTSKQYKLKAAAQTIDQALQAAKYDAIRQNLSRTVVFDLANNSVIMSNGTEIKLPAGITFTGPENTSAPSMIVSGAAAATAANLAAQEDDSKEACSFPVDTTNSNKRRATFTSRGVPDVTPGAFNWVYLKNGNSERAAVVLSSAGSTARFTKMEHSGWKGSSSTGSSSDDSNDDYSSNSAPGCAGS